LVVKESVAGQFRSLDGALENGELMARSEDHKLQCRPAPEGCENTAATRADNRCLEGNRTESRNSQLINLIGVCEIHRLGNGLIIAPQAQVRIQGAIRRRTWLGGMLNYYYRQAA
jgi:hypothetical protein